MDFSRVLLVYTNANANTVAAGRPRNAMFYIFSEVLEEILDVNG